MKRRNLILLILLGLIAVLVLLAVWKGQSRPKGTSVTMDSSERRTIEEMVSGSGKIFPETEVKISSDVSGEIVELYVEEGDSVKAGQLLSRIDPDAFQSAVERGRASVNNAKAQLANAKAGVERSRANLVQAEAQVEQIEAQLINARTIHERNVDLLKEGVISQADFDASLSNMESLEANLRSSKANLKAMEASLESARQTAKAAAFTVKSSEASLDELQTSLRRTSIYSPVDGIVSLLNVEQGERVVGTIQMTGTELMRIADMRTMEVQVDVNENDVLRISVGDPAEVEVDAYLDRTFKGVVTKIANTASNATSSAVSLTSDQVTNFVVKIRLDPDSYRPLISPTNPYPFRPGMSATVDIQTEVKADVLAVPLQAVAARERKEVEPETRKQPAGDDLLEVVFVVNADTVAIREVQTGIQDDEYIEITQGLQEGETVVSGPYSAVSRELEQGDAVRKKEEKSTWSD